MNEELIKKWENSWERKRKGKECRKSYWVVNKVSEVITKGEWKRLREQFWESWEYLGGKWRVVKVVWGHCSSHKGREWGIKEIIMGWGRGCTGYNFTLRITSVKHLRKDLDRMTGVSFRGWLDKVNQSFFDNNRNYVVLRREVGIFNIAF